MSSKHKVFFGILVMLFTAFFLSSCEGAGPSGDDESRENTGNGGTGGNTGNGGTGGTGQGGTGGTGQGGTGGTGQGGTGGTGQGDTGGTGQGGTGGTGQGGTGGTGQGDTGGTGQGGGTGGTGQGGTGGTGQGGTGGTGQGGTGGTGQGDTGGTGQGDTGGTGQGDTDGTGQGDTGGTGQGGTGGTGQGNTDGTGQGDTGGNTGNGGTDTPIPPVITANPNNWKKVSPNPTTNTLYKVAFGDTHFVAVGDNGTGLYSTDGATWGTAPLLSNREIIDMTFDHQNQVVAIDSSAYIYTSTDNGATWYEKQGQYTLIKPSYTTKVSFPLELSPFSMTASNEKLLILGTGGIWPGISYKVYISQADDYTKWKLIIPPESSFQVRFLNGMFFLGTTNGKIYHSNDGETWESTTKSGIDTIQDIAYGNGILVAIAESNIYTSADTQTWDKKVDGKLEAFNTLRGVTFGDGYFVAGGDAGIIYYSLNGETWIKATSAGTGKIRSLSFGNKIFVAVGENGVIYYSAP